MREQLAAAAPDAEVTTWAGLKPPSWLWRRMTHELAVHRWDAQSAAGEPHPVDAAVAADGIDELLEAFAPIADLSEVGGTIHLHATDGGGEWFIETEDALSWSRAHEKADVAVRGTASDLLLLLWGRVSPEHLEVLGDEAVLERWHAATRFRALVPAILAPAGRTRRGLIPAERGGWMRYGRRVAAVVVALAAVLTSCGGDDGGGGGGDTEGHSESTSNGGVGPGETTTIELDGADRPEAVAATEEAVWVADEAAHTLTRIDPETAEVVDTFAPDDFNQPSGVAATDDAVWVTSILDEVQQVDPETGEVTAVVEVGGAPKGITFYEESLWTADIADGTVTRVDASSLEVIATIDVGPQPVDVAASDGAVWVAGLEGAVSRIDVETNEVTDVLDLPTDFVGAIAAEGNTVIVTATFDDAVMEIDADRAEVVATYSLFSPDGVAVDGGDVWVSGQDGVALLDRETGGWDGVDTGEDPVGVALTDGAVWVADPIDRTLTVVGR